MEKNGLIIVDKDPGISSFSAVSRLKRMLGIKRIGHCGTLDPFATGVLPIAFGRGTAAIRFMEDYRKTYEVLAVLGERRDTLDREGEVVDTFPQEKIRGLVEIDELNRRITKACSEMRGDIEQIPPMFSAIKHKGKALYEYARKGEIVPRKPRPVNVLIEDLSLVPVQEIQNFLRDKNFKSEWPLPTETEFYLYARLDVSKGTYIRTWIDDFGKEIGTFAYCENLKRINCGPFNLGKLALTTEQLFEKFHSLSDDKEKMYTHLYKEGIILGIEAAFADFPRIEVDREVAQDVVHGKLIQVTKGEMNYPLNGDFIMMYNDWCLALAQVECSNSNNLNVIKTKRVFLSHEAI